MQKQLKRGEMHKAKSPSKYFANYFGIYYNLQ